MEPGDEIHLHARGQGFWVARMIARLGVPVTLCCALGGETGQVLCALVAREQVGLRAVAAGSGNGAYLHDRRGGEDRTVAATAARPLQRHEADDLFGAALAQGLGATVTVLTGTDPAALVDAGFYQRLAGDLRRNGRAVIADLSGEALETILGTDVTLLKSSDAELAADGRAGTPARPAFAAWMRQANTRGAASVVVSRAAEPTLALLEGQLVAAHFPVTRTGDSHGAGDSPTAGIAATLATGGGLREALRLGTAAGTLNAARRGLGT